MSLMSKYFSKYSTNWAIEFLYLTYRWIIEILGTGRWFDTLGIKVEKGQKCKIIIRFSDKILYTDYSFINLFTFPLSSPLFTETPVSNALLIKPKPKKQTGFVLVLNQSKLIYLIFLKTKRNQIDLVFDNEN